MHDRGSTAPTIHRARGAALRAALSRGCLAWALIALLGAPSAAAQSGTGRLVGRVVSAQTGEPLVAVQLSVAGVGSGTLSDASGRYVLTGLPAGNHQVVAQSLGYATKTVTGVAVTGGAATVLDVSLEPQAVALEGVTVSAARERGSTTSLLSDRQRAGVMMDAIGRQQISQTSDGDAAAALKRVPGVSVVDGKFVYVRGLGERYGATTLNGAPLASPLPDKKAVPLDLIPASMLESVVTAKTYSPELPGDYAGGLVQLETRNYPTSRFLRLSTSVALESNTSLKTGLGYAGSGTDWLGFDDGARGLPAGVSATSPIRIPSDPTQRSAFVQAVSGPWVPVASDVPVNQGYGATYGDEIQLGGRPLGFIASASYSNSYSTTAGLRERFYAAGMGPSLQVDYTGESTTHTVGLGGLLNGSYALTPTDRVSANVVYTRQADDQARDLGGLFESQGPYLWTPRLHYVASEMASAQLRGEHLLAPLGRTTAKWRLGASRTGRYEPNTRTVVYRAGEPEGPFEFFPGPSSGLVFHQDLQDDGLSGAVDFRTPFTLRSLPASLSFGGSAELRDRSVYTRRYRFVPVGEGLSQEELRLRPDALFTAERIGSSLDVVESTFREDNYDAGLDVLAGYAMADAEILPGLRAVAGARVERASQDVQVRDILGISTGEVPGSSYQDTDLLPALNLTYSATERMNLRFGVSRTVARPQFREQAPFLYADYYGGLVSRGNPYVERSRITNLDARWEWFPELGSVLSLGGFYKDFTDPIEPFAFLLGSTPAQTWVNTAGAELYGGELEFRSGLGVLSERLESFSVNLNATVARSGVVGDSVVIYSPDTGSALQIAATGYADRPMFGQSPYVLNAGLTWQAPVWGASGTLLFNRFGRRLDAFGGQGLPDIYEEGRSQLDLVYEQEIGSGMELKLSAGRLLGNAVRFTQTFGNGETVTTRSYDTGRTLSLSLSWNPWGGQ